MRFDYPVRPPTYAVPVGGSLDIAGDLLGSRALFLHRRGRGDLRNLADGR